jgi:Tfp pilus assembly major pilin PilA
VLGTLKLKPDWSDRAIAKHVGVSNNFVSTERRHLSSDDSEASAQRTVKRGGVEYTMDTTGQKQAAKAKKAQPAGTNRATTTVPTATPEQCHTTRHDAAATTPTAKTMKGLGVERSTPTAAPHGRNATSPRSPSTQNFCVLSAQQPHNGCDQAAAAP